MLRHPSPEDRVPFAGANIPLSYHRDEIPAQGYAETAWAKNHVHRLLKEQTLEYPNKMSLWELLVKNQQIAWRTNLSQWPDVTYSPLPHCPWSAIAVASSLFMNRTVGKKCPRTFISGISKSIYVANLEYELWQSLYIPTPRIVSVSNTYAYPQDSE